MRLEPLGTKVVVKVKAAEKKTKSGVIIPDAAKDAPSVGTIVAINEDTKEDFNIDVGTQLLFGKYAGTEVEVDGEKLMVLEIDEAFAIIREDEEEKDD